MLIWKAVLLGIIQGITEFLPISSSGHLVLAKQLLGVELGKSGTFFDVMLHIGTLLAICAAFRKDIFKIIKESIHIIIDFLFNIFIFFHNIFYTNKPYRCLIKSSYRKYAALIVISTIPTGILGLLLSNVVEVANSMVIVSGICFIITAIFLLIADLTEVGYKRPKETSYIDALIVGISQGLAVMPGISRSGATITAGLLCGFDKKFVIKYSFIMSIPAVLGAAIFEISKIHITEIVIPDIPAYIVATIMAALVGYISICFMIKIVCGKKYKYFSIYCTIIGIAAIIYSTMNY